MYKRPLRRKIVQKEDRDEQYGLRAEAMDYQQESSYGSTSYNVSGPRDDINRLQNELQSMSGY